MAGAQGPSTSTSSGNSIDEEGKFIVSRFKDCIPKLSEADIYYYKLLAYIDLFAKPMRSQFMNSWEQLKGQGLVLEKDVDWRNERTAKEYEKNPAWPFKNCKDHTLFFNELNPDQTKTFLESPIHEWDTKLLLECYKKLWKIPDKSTRNSLMSTEQKEIYNNIKNIMVLRNAIYHQSGRPYTLDDFDKLRNKLRNYAPFFHVSDKEFDRVDYDFICVNKIKEEAKEAGK